MNGPTLIRCWACSGLANRFELNTHVAEWSPVCLAHANTDRAHYLLPMPGGYPLPDYRDRSDSATDEETVTHA